MTQSTDIAVRRFLDENSTLTLACSDEQGPWAADVYFVRKGRALYFYSSPDSRHALAFALDPRAAATIHGEYEGWEDIRGVQLSGSVCAISSPAEKAGVLASYFVKFPFVEAFLRGAGKAALQRARFHRIDPERVYWVDNSKGFGNRQEIPW